MLAELCVVFRRINDKIILIRVDKPKYCLSDYLQKLTPYVYVLATLCDVFLHSTKRSIVLNNLHEVLFLCAGHTVSHAFVSTPCGVHACVSPCASMRTPVWCTSRCVPLWCASMCASTCVPMRCASMCVPSV